MKLSTDILRREHRELERRLAFADREPDFSTQTQLALRMLAEG